MIISETKLFKNLTTITLEKNLWKNVIGLKKTKIAGSSKFKVTL